PFFIGAVIIAHQLGAAQTLLDLLAFAFVMVRIFYILMYVSDMPTARSAMWAGGFFINIAILVVGYR
ncbi:MAG: MAPEG family protein, partial [Burkholderiaceae bacterium]